jgi:MoaA/NifB/PqqE/SkfB family radical SAM enzyme
MDFLIIEDIINETVKNGLNEIIPSTMGEPLLYKSFFDILKLLRKHNIKMNLTTNGTFPKLGAEEWGKLILPIASDIKVSINGASKEMNESIMEGIKFEKQIANIEKCIEIRNNIRQKGINNPTITFQATFMEKNLVEMPELLRLAINMDIDRFKGHHLWITHPELETQSLRKNKESIRKWNRIVEKMYKIAETERLKSGKEIKLANIYPVPYNPNKNIIFENYICPFLGRELWIAWDGTFNVCCAPDELRKTLGNFGNVKNSNFTDLWNSQKYTALIKNWGNYEVCKMCNMRKPIRDIEAC